MYPWIDWISSVSCLIALQIACYWPRTQPHRSNNPRLSSHVAPPPNWVDADKYSLDVRSTCFDGIILTSGQRTLRKYVPMQWPFTLSLVISTLDFNFLTVFLPFPVTIDIRRSLNSPICLPNVASSSWRESINASLSTLISVIVQLSMVVCNSAYDRLWSNILVCQRQQHISSSNYDPFS